MKFQCPCGAKYAFDITPDMVQRPVGFVCPTCGLDSSAAVNESIRAQFPAPTPTALVPVPPTTTQPQVRLHQAASRGTATSTATEGALCPKHLGQRAVENCVVCGKPICPQCMKLFGYVCSPLCRQKGELSGMEIPVYESQNSIQERKFQRKLNLTIIGGASALAVIIGVWMWYLLIGSQPRVAYSVRFAQLASSGKIHLVGKDQIVFIHGSTIARHDVKAKKEIWSGSLVDRQLHFGISRSVAISW